MSIRGIPRQSTRGWRVRKAAAEALEPRRMLSAELVKDINTNRPGADFQPAYYAAAGSIAYFTDDDGVNGEEVWKTDGTAANTTMVKDIYPGAEGSYPGYYTTLNGITYFNATDSNGSELWRTDGTAAGTYLVKDINPGSASSNPSDLTVYNGYLYFFADDGTHGRELWRSDGTSAGTQLVVDTDPGSGGQNAPSATFSRIAVTANGAMVFVAFNGSTTNLYSTTGAIGNETLLKSGIISGNPGMLVSSTGTIAFFQDETTGYLYQTDGTVAGTVLDYSADNGAKDLLVAGNYLYFVDGTTLKCIGTGLNKSFSGSYSSPTPVAVSNSNAYFQATYTTSNTPSLWYANATLPGTVLVENNVTAVTGQDVNGTLFFVAGTSTSGYSLWKTNSSSGVTSMITSLNPGGNYAVPGFLTAFGSKLLFNNTDSVNGLQPWISDGTSAGTGLLKAIYPGTAGSFPILFNLTLNNKVLFSATDGGTEGYQLWASDGTTAGTTVLTNINPGNTISHIGSVFQVGSLAYFSDYDPTNGYALWVTDGTVAGTRMVIATNPSSSVAPVPLGYVNGWLLFSANDATHGTELWRTDGTTADTQLLMDIDVGTASSSPSNAVVMNGFMYFSATDATHGNELWRTDGTTAGTTLVDDIYPGTASSGISSMFVYNNLLLFSAESGSSTGDELWSSNGTAAGTSIVKDIYPGSTSSTPRLFTLYNGLVYFAATDTNGSGVWRTDGTAAGTTLVADDQPSSFVVNNGSLYFIGNNGSTLDQLYVSQGTPMTTSLITSASGPYAGGSLTVVGGRVFMVAEGSNAGDYELWTSDGTSAGTVEVQDLFPGPFQGVAGKIVGINGNVFVQGDNSVSGRELYEFPDVWAPQLYAASASVVTDTISFSFSENVSADLSASSLQLQDLTTNSSVTVASTGYNYNTATNTATFTLPAAALSIGRYRATIPAALLADAAGNVPASNATLEFLSFAAGSGSNSISVQPSTDNTQIQVYLNASLAFTTPVASLGSILVTGGSGNDALSLNLGSTLVPGGYSFNGGSGTNTFTVVGQTGVHTLSVSAAGMLYEDTAITAVNAQPLIFDADGATDAITDYSTLGFPSALGTGRTISSLNLTGTLDLNNNSADLPGASLAAITAAVKSGFNGGAWNGSGIVSAAAAGDSNHLTALGVIANNQGGTALFSSSRLFDGTSPGAGDVLIKYTFYGDTNFDGKVDGTDYSRVDAAYINHTLTGWFNGDFNYDGVVDGSDYTLIDNAFNRQGSVFSTEIASPAAAIADSAGSADVVARFVPQQNSPATSAIDNKARHHVRSSDVLDELNAH